MKLIENGQKIMKVDVCYGETHIDVFYFDVTSDEKLVTYYNNNNNLSLDLHFRKWFESSCYYGAYVKPEYFYYFDLIILK
jgi:hypothetical protein